MSEPDPLPSQPPPPGVAHPPPAPAPPRRSRTIPVVAGLAVLLLLGAGVAFALLRPDPAPTTADAAATQQTTTRRPTPTRTRSPRPTPTAAPRPTPYTGSLDDLLLPLPSGATAMTVTIINAEMTPAEQIGTLWSPADPEPMTTLLTDLDLARTAVRAWQHNTDTVILGLLQFETRSDALDWAFVASRSLTTTADAYGTSSGLITGIRGSHRWAEILDVATRNIELRAAFSRGDMGVVIMTATGSAEVKLDALKAMAIEQFERLPGA